MVSFLFGGAKSPPDKVSCVLIPELTVFASMVSADFDINIEDWWKPVFNVLLNCSVMDSGSSIWVEELLIHLSGRTPPATVSEWAEVERTNCLTCFWCAVKKVPPGVWVVSGCYKKLWNLVLLEVFWIVLSVTIDVLDWALCWCDIAWLLCSTIVEELDCRLCERVLCDMHLVVITLSVVPSSSGCSSGSISLGVVTMYGGVDVSSRDIFTGSIMIDQSQ